ncbi:MAG: hypothetical protein M5U33_01420 [Pseudorhodoplanes sp.]|nr:hypothetical protein [Pseudorhodoplanes sp.]
MHAGSAIGFEGGLVEFWNYLIQSGEIWGYLGAVVTIGTYSMRTMIPLRVVGICANILFIIYGLVAEVYPQFALHVILLPLNIGRLYQMVRLVAQVKEASGGSLSMDWIRASRTGASAGRERRSSSRAIRPTRCSIRSADAIGSKRSMCRSGRARSSARSGW